MLIGHLLSFLKFPGEDQIANLREILQGIRIVIIVGTAGPERKHSLSAIRSRCDSTEYHYAPMRPLPIGIASGSFFRGLAIPEDHVAGRRRGNPFGGYRQADRQYRHPMKWSHVVLLPGWMLTATDTRRPMSCP